MTEGSQAQIVPFSSEDTETVIDVTDAVGANRSFKEAERVAEALVFASSEPVAEKDIAKNCLTGLM